MQVIYNTENSIFSQSGSVMLEVSDDFIRGFVFASRLYKTKKRFSILFVASPSDSCPLSENNLECIVYFLSDKAPLELIEIRLCPPSIQQYEEYQDLPKTMKKREFCIERDLNLIVKQKIFLTESKRKLVFRNENPAIISESYNINFFESRTFYKISGFFYQPAFDFLHYVKSTDKYIIGIGRLKKIKTKMLGIWSKETYQIQKVKPLGSLSENIHLENIWTVNDYLLFIYDFDEHKIKVYNLFENKIVQLPKHFTLKEKKDAIIRNNLFRTIVATNDFLFILYDELHRFRLKYL